MILKLLLFFSLLILSSSQEDDDAGNETAECDLVSQPTSLLVDSKSGNRVITSALPRIPELGFCPFPPYSCRLPRRLRKYLECCDNSVCMYTSARRRYCWRNYLSGNDLSGTQKARQHICFKSISTHSVYLSLLASVLWIIKATQC